MKTKKLYRENSYKTEFSALITESTEVNGKPAVVLDETCFYPTSGGQLHDTGIIENIPVIEVIEDDSIIYHVLDGEIPPGEKVRCEIDWIRRFDNMQQHTGQHILSQSFIKTSGAETVSSSLGQEISTIDLNRPDLSVQDAEKAEAEANMWIYRNVPVNIIYPDMEELERLPLRKKPPEGKKVRLIHIEGLDYSPCGGTHCSHTGEVGMVKIRQWKKMRGNVRVEFYCGERALIDYRSKMKVVNSLISSLSAQEFSLVSTAEKLAANIRGLSKTNRELKNKLFEHKAGEIYSQAEIAGNFRIAAFEDDAESIDDLKKRAQIVRTEGPGIVIIGSRTEKPFFVLTRTDKAGIDLTDILNKLKEKFSLKGGGSPGMVQGALDNEEDMEPFLAEAGKIAKERLKVM